VRLVANRHSQLLDGGPSSMPREQRVRNEQIARGDYNAADHDGKANSVGEQETILN